LFDWKKLRDPVRSVVKRATQDMEVAMVLNLRPKCANPSCAASFDWFAGGKLFRFPRERHELSSADGKDTRASGSHPIGHFWLCERCSNVYTLQYQRDRGVAILPLWPELPAAKNNMHLPAS
jgi:hypothetical protein